MKKIVMWSILALLAANSPAFAQGFWKSIGKSGAANLGVQAERKLAMEVLSKSTTGLKPVRIPAYLNMGTKVYVNSIKMPKADFTTVSYLYKVKNLSNKAKEAGVNLNEVEIRCALADEWLHGPGQNLGVGHVFYEDQAQLARDLNTFYKGSGTAVQAFNGRLVKLYTLPVDKILYKPAGRALELISNEEYFVVYDVAGKTGQLVKRTPETLKEFSKRTNSGTFEEVTVLDDQVFYVPDGEPDWNLLKGVQKAKAPKPEGDFEEIYSEPLLEDAHAGNLDFRGAGRPATAEELEELTWLNEQADREMKVEAPLFAGVSRPGTPEEVYQFKKLEYQQNLAEGNRAAELVWEKGHYPTFFSSQDQLGEELHRFHKGIAAKVQEVFPRRVSYVYEIPVEELYIKEANGMVYVIDPENYVVLYNEKTGGQLVARRILENQQVYKFVE